MLKVLTKGCEPYRGTRFSAALDLSSSENVVIEPNSTAIVGLGVCIDDDGLIKDASEEFMMSHYLELHPRSSLRAKGLISNTGVIDLDYVPSCGLGYSIDDYSCMVFTPTREDVLMKNECENCKHFIQNEIKIIIYNPRTTVYRIKKGDRIAQILLKEHCSYHFNVDNDTDRTRVCGFGSTGGVK